LLLLLLAALAAGAALKEVVAPGLVRRRLISAVKDSCETCELSLGRVRISVLPLALSAGPVRFTGGRPNATVVQARSERVYVPFSLLPLFKGRFRLGRIEVERSEVIVTEGDLVSPSLPEAGAAPPDIEIEGLVVKNSSFTYIREYPGRKGILGVSGINAAFGPIGTSARLRAEDAEAAADGLLERSGQFRLEVRARVFAKAPDVDVKIKITGHDLSTLNRFFKPNDGVQLHGVLIEGRSSVEIRGAALNASAYVLYRGLSVKIKKNGDRTALSAFFQNLLAAVTIGRQNVEGGKYDRLGKVELERKSKETLISFALRGMKEAAMQVSARGPK